MNKKRLQHEVGVQFVFLPTWRSIWARQNTLAVRARQRHVVNEPVIVAINKSTGEVVAVRARSKRDLGRTTGNVVAIKPMKAA